MQIPLIDIGNSKGIRIPQAILKQVNFGARIELEIIDGKIVLHRTMNPDIVPDFDSISKMDDTVIQGMLRRISGTDLITALIGAKKSIKEAIYRNLSDRVRNHVAAKVTMLEKGDARDLIIERSRNLMSEAFMALLNE